MRDAKLTELSLRRRGDNKPTAIDLFSGCGGLSLGLTQVGFQVIAAVEVDRKAQETYSLNHPTVKLYKQDIRGLDAQSILEELGLKRGELSLLAGCPPCQGFSRLRTRNMATSVFDLRNNLVSEFLRFVETLFPKTIMLENVPALAGDRRFKLLRKRFEEMGYSSVVSVLDAADYSVPQRRKRLILLASRMHEPAIAKKHLRRRTVRDALIGVGAPSTSADKLHSLPERRSPKVRQLIALIPKDGGSRRDLTVSHQLACHKRCDGFGDVYGRMAWDDVAPTITSGCFNPSKGRFLHPSFNRAITLREAALLQGFPKNYRFDVGHGKESIALMIGNALPPQLIAAQAKELLRGLSLASGRETLGGVRS